MRSSKNVLRILAAALFAVSAASVWAGSGWSRYRVWTRSDAEVQRLADSSLGQFSEQLVLGENEVIVGPLDMFQLIALGLPYSRVGELPDPRGWDFQPAGNNYRTSYFDMDQLLAFFDNLASSYPLLIRKQQVAVSRNGEPVWGYLVFNQIERDVAVPPANVLIIGGTHAREWIAPSVVMHVAVKLIQMFTSSESVLGARMSDRVGVWFIPGLNPDGYRYTWTNNRFWRKNRRNNGNGSFGVDLNRNYSIGWGGAGSSGTPSSENYRGPSAFSEPEIDGLRVFSGYLPNVLAAIDFHSYGQQILYPWSYTTAPTPDAAWLDSIGDAMRDAITAGGGNSYVSGQASTTLYVAGGTSKDWFYDAFGSASYTIELRDTGQNGFLLPELQITPTQNEGWNAMVALFQRVVP